MEELLASWAGTEQHMLQIGQYRRDRPDRRDVVKTPPPNEDRKRSESGQVVDQLRGVSVWNLIADDMEQRPQRDRSNSRTTERAARSASRRMKGNDHPST